MAKLIIGPTFSVRTGFRRKQSEGAITLSLITALVWFLAISSALGVVYSTHESRKATQRLEELRREAIGLKVMAGKYLLEKSSWSAYSRVEKIAFDELRMSVPETDQTVLVYKK